MKKTLTTKTGNWKTKKPLRKTTILSIITLITILCAPNIIGLVSAASTSIFEDNFESIKPLQIRGEQQE